MPRLRRAFLLAAASAVAALTAPVAGAQGTLGVQGFGYPTGQVGSGSLGMGGANAEYDPASPLNPAALGVLSRFSVYAQYEPEYRRTSAPNGADKSTVFRFPTFLISGAVGRFTGGLSASTFLDRTWRNVVVDTQIVGGDPTESTLIAGSNGAITDARAAVAYWVSPKLQVGLAFHALVGENRLEFGRSFPDSSGVGDVSQLSTINYSGRALSAGVVYVPTRQFVIGASLRRGGSLDARQDSAALSEATVPDRVGLTIAYTGIPNTTLAARFDRTNWTAMDDLGSATMSTFDATDIGLGLEVLGPRINQANSFARLGFRSRTLPFGADGEQVAEKSVSGGVSIPMARGRAQVDLTLQRAMRTAGDVRERAWVVSIGLGIRP